MNIIGTAIKSVEGKINSPVAGKVSIEYIPTIKDVMKTKIVETISENKKIDALDIKYSIDVKYKAEGGDKIYAILSLEGDIVIKVKDENEAKSLKEEWEKNKTLKGMEIAILNVILRKSIPKLVVLSDMMSLPPVIQIPKFVKSQNKK